MSASPNEPTPDKESPFAFLDWLPWEKITMWGLFLGSVYVLRSFFFIVFMTFIVAYTMRGVVVRISSLFGSKEHVWLERILSVVCFAALLAAIGALGRYFGPELYSQGEKLVAKVDTIVGNPQEKLDDVLIDVIGPFLVSDKFGEPGDETYDTAFENYQRQGLQYDQYKVFTEQLRRLESNFLEELTRERVARVGTETVEEDERKRELVDFILSVDGEVIRNETEEVYEKDRAADRAKDPFNKNLRPPFQERKKEEQQFFVERHIEETILKIPARRGKYEQDRLKALQELERDKVSTLKTTSPAEYEQLFSAYYARLGEDDTSGLTYDYEKFRELREAVQNPKDPVLQFSLVVEDLLPENETPEERLARERAGFEEYLRAKEVEEWKSGDLYRTIGAKADEYIGQGLNFLAAKLGVMVSKLLSLPVQLALSLLLSLFIVFDIHRLKKGVKRLKDSRLSKFYDEISPGLISFGKLIGRAFQAQAVIAIFNTILTFLAIRFLEIQNEAFLCSIVFVCSFIPVLGVVLSSVPIAIMAIVQDGGNVLLAVWAVVAILGIHFVETSILNPKILGEMLHLHPVLVLAILAVGEHFFGVWGLLLGVPVIVYIIRFVILDEGIPGIIEPIRKQREIALSSAGPAASALSAVESSSVTHGSSSADKTAEEAPSDAESNKVVAESRGRS